MVVQEPTEVRRGSGSLGAELVDVVSHHEDTGNRTQVLFKSGKQS